VRRASVSSRRESRYHRRSNAHSSPGRREAKCKEKVRVRASMRTGSSSMRSSSRAAAAARAICMSRYFLMRPFMRVCRAAAMKENDCACAAQEREAPHRRRSAPQRPRSECEERDLLSHAQMRLRDARRLFIICFCFSVCPFPVMMLSHVSASRCC